MKVKMKVGMSGSLDGVPYPARGEVFEVNDIAGAQLCAKGLAEPVAEKASEKVEKAVAPEAETREDKGPLTTESGTTRRGPGRPRKEAESK